MKTEFKAANPDEIIMKLTIKMTLKEWKELKSQLPNKYPAWSFGDEITEMVQSAETHFYPKQDKE